MMTPEAAPRVAKGPSGSPYGSRAKPMAFDSHCSRGDVASVAMAKATAESSFAASKPRAAGGRDSHEPAGGTYGAVVGRRGWACAALATSSSVR